jgi:hypothetical protein
MAAQPLALASGAMNKMTAATRNKNGDIAGSS